MSLPHGWTLASLGELVTLQTGPFGSSLHQSDYVTGGTPIVNPMHIRGGRIRPSAEHTVAAQTVERLSDFKLHCGDIVIGRRGEMGRCAVVTAREQGWLCGTGSMIIRCTVALLPAFLQRLLTTRESVDFLGQESVGSTMANLNQKILLGLPVRLPPLAEQQRIVDSLETSDPSLDDAVAELATAKRKLAFYRQSLLKSAVEGALTAEWRDRRGLAHGDTANLPADWQLCAINEIGTVQLGRQRSPDKLGGANPTPYVRAANITEQGVDLSDVLAMDFSESEIRTFALQPGDVLLTEASGSAEHVGRPAVWSRVEGTYCFQNTVVRFRPRSVSSEFAYFLFMAQQKLGVFAKLSAGVGINHLSAGKFGRLQVPVPPADEQQEIVERLQAAFEAVAEQERAIDWAMSRASAQRQNILRAAFSGQLVPQDPNDEPASVLLERIRAQRVASGDKPTARRPRKAKTAA